MGQIGRVLLVASVVLFVAGALFVALGALGVGRLPGDLRFERNGVRIFIPIATSLVLSVILTIVLNILIRR